MTNASSRWKPAFLPDPLGHLERLQLILPWRAVVDRHYAYGAMDQSARTGNVKIRPSFDNSWGCFDQCRPYKEEAEADRVLRSFDGRLMFLNVVANGERNVVQRLTKDVGYQFAALPTGDHLAVLSTGPLGEYSFEVSDQEHMVRDVVMKVRWFGSISSSQGFLPSAREAKAWEAYHATTGRRCFHAHETRVDATTCAAETGIEVDGSSDGWYVRGTSGWMKLGTVRLKTLRELAESAKACGLDVTPHMDAETEAIGRLSIGAIGWVDPRFVRFREENHWKEPRTASGAWQPPILPQVWSIDSRGRVTGS